MSPIEQVSRWRLYVMGSQSIIKTNKKQNTKNKYAEKKNTSISIQ